MAVQSFYAPLTIIKLTESSIYVKRVTRMTPKIKNTNNIIEMKVCVYGYNNELRIRT